FGLGVGTVGFSKAGVGVLALATPNSTTPVPISAALYAYSDGNPSGVFASSVDADGVFGINRATINDTSAGAGVDGSSSLSYGVYGESGNSIGVFGRTSAPNGAGVEGMDKSGSLSGYLGGPGYGVAGIGGSAGDGVLGTSTAGAHAGVHGTHN